MAKLPAAIGQPHAHAGVSVRRFGKYLECRAGLQLRVIFVIADASIVLFTVGNHNDVARFIKNN